MALEAAIFHQQPFKDNNNTHMGVYGIPFPTDLLQENNFSNLAMDNFDGYWDSLPATSMAQTAGASSPETTCGPVDGLFSGGMVAAALPRRKRRRTKSMKNKEEMENQRMTHIAVERNRRRQMNDYLAILRSLMPPSYAQRGDQASIVGGAINFVKELEQLLQSLRAHKATSTHQHSNSLFSNLFSFPQYSTNPTAAVGATARDTAAERRSDIADIEVNMVESHANIKILTRRCPKQLLKTVAGFQSIGFTVLHLSITTVDQSVLYTFSVKVEDECQLSTVNEIATTVHDILRMIQDEVSI